MKQIIRIARTELQLLFYSPIAWLILLVFTIQAGLVFSDALGNFVNAKSQGFDLSGVTLKIYTDPWQGFFSKLLGYLYFYIPLLTMGMVSRELSSGSIKLLYASPINDSQIIFGKFLALVCYAVLMVGLVFAFDLYGFFIIDNFDFKSTLPGILGLFLLICAYGSIGLFMSSLTSYQVVAAIGTLAVFAVLNYVNQVWQDVSFVRDIMFWLSISGRTNEFIGGVISSEDVIYFLTVIALFLSLSILRFTSVRQKIRVSVAMGRYVLAIACAVLIGYFSSRPTLMAYYDATRTKLRTLTEASQEIVGRVKGDITITTYANALDEDRLLWMGMPKAELVDIQRFKEYFRFKPDIRMAYVRYYAKGNNEKSLNHRYPKLSDEERVGKVAQSYGVDSNLFLPVNQLGPIKETLARENFRHIKIIEHENGRKAILRVFDDPQRFPSEREISVAFKRLIDTLPQVGFVEGHGERNYLRTGDRGYNRFSQERVFRYSLINQGFDIQQLSLDKPVPLSIHILVIADMKTAMPETHMNHLKQYIDRGGNLFIAAEPNRQESMRDLMALFGVRLMEGRLVKPSENYQSDIIFSRPSKASGQLARQFTLLRERNQVVTMPEVVGLDYTGAREKGFTAIPLLVADSSGVWNELETTDFVDDTVRMNPDIGEYEIPNIPTAVALQREVGQKHQKIIILGDADCISNGELNRRRKDVPAANFGIIVGSFYWMSDDEVPLEISRPPFTDNDIHIGKAQFTISKWVAVGVLPGLLALGYLIVWLRRRAK